MPYFPSRLRVLRAKRAFVPSRLTCLRALRALLTRLIYALVAFFSCVLRALFVRLKIFLGWICSPAETFHFQKTIKGTTSRAVLSGEIS